MLNSTQPDLLKLSSNFSKMLKKRFGKGPESCLTVLNKGRLYIFVRNFITPAEEVLIENEEWELANHFRSAVFDSVIQEFIAKASKVLEIDFKYFFHDWNYSSNTGLVFLEHLHVDEEKVILDSQSNRFLKVVEEIGLQLHKKPEEIRMFMNTHNMCGIEISGIQTHLETLLFKNGNSHFLQQHLTHIKQGYLKHKKQLESILNYSVDDVFVMCDYERNRYVLFLIFSKKAI
ncbi:hypothetical protein J27TS8_41280 [Robertmurraya siralis]|uniref:Na+-translocating membrane potential-generating system MpsC domain-containing protein n=1 Tax=Robertmurraya siralis TaxID=77777 RepID=A0A919WLD7_9BACI|nr:Na-translocating system protein MpsC family protein [Robertmurraya siralis]PAE20945.1 hypothetical protein CHH80_08825 [Bacillus sp. 7504-2]GIN64135.1 hypothetical protein J27TS8_41280 [Robertmurraya siralis]